MIVVATRDAAFKMIEERKAHVALKSFGELEHEFKSAFRVQQGTDVLACGYIGLATRKLGDKFVRIKCDRYGIDRAALTAFSEASKTTVVFDVDRYATRPNPVNLGAALTTGRDATATAHAYRWKERVEGESASLLDRTCTNLLDLWRCLESLPRAGDRPRLLEDVPTWTATRAHSTRRYIKHQCHVISLHCFTSHPSTNRRRDECHFIFVARASLAIGVIHTLRKFFCFETRRACAGDVDCSMSLYSKFVYIVVTIVRFADS